MVGTCPDLELILKVPCEMCQYHCLWLELTIKFIKNCCLVLAYNTYLDYTHAYYCMQNKTFKMAAPKPKHSWRSASAEGELAATTATLRRFLDKINATCIPELAHLQAIKDIKQHEDATQADLLTVLTDIIEGQWWVQCKVPGDVSNTTYPVLLTMRLDTRPEKCHITADLSYTVLKDMLVCTADEHNGVRKLLQLSEHTQILQKIISAEVDWNHMIPMCQGLIVKSHGFTSALKFYRTAGLDEPSAYTKWLHMEFTKDPYCVGTMDELFKSLDLTKKVEDDKLNKAMANAVEQSLAAERAAALPVSSVAVAVAAPALRELDSALSISDAIAITESAHATHTAATRPVDNADPVRNL